ncbi:histidine kinase [Actinosynnema sp. NPDC047251]|uniref:histidine kinase n=1 Tax=Saccharothrix espanaensis (strain ATCC 51144 / DSM 44229 / JCM 9112 / NBRC 15066 / NRRL 15764) TaxID=1179773 RepID=K0JWP2_SACES|nr:histidine kinase [Saccharothrix espanaensis]CCH30471.1 putative histidine kinase [Saccharothrix espanaensis DSM 44229]
MKFRPKNRDLLVAVGFLAIGMLIYHLEMDVVFSRRSADAPLGTHVAVLAVACVGTAFRRSLPAFALVTVAAAAAVDLTLGLSLPVIMVFVDVLFVVTLEGPRRLHQALIGVVAVATLGLTLTVAVLFDWRESIYAGFQVFSLFGVPVWWATNIRQHRDSARQVARIAELDRRAAVDAERNRMARDLHDVIAGHLSAIAIQSEAVLSMPADSETVRTVLRSVRENSVRSLEEMRTMIDVLRADDPVDEPVAVRLADAGRLVESARAGGLDVDFEMDRVEDLPVAVDVAAYRILQEALTNALKHGSSASVRVERQIRRLVVVVRNTAREASKGSGTGLVSMAERAHAVHGTLVAGRDGDQWLVRAELPL